MSIEIATNTPLRVVPSDYAPVGSERWFRIPEGPDAGKTMFYVDHPVGDAANAPVVLFVHGNPECSYTYRKARDRLIERGAACRIVAMDHVGFGLSDQATYEPIDMHHAANLRQLVRHLDLRQVILVVHDWGGPIGIGAMIEDAERVVALTVMNTTIFPMPSDGFTYENYPISWLPWCSTPKIIPDVLWPAVGAYVVPHASPQSSVTFLGGVGWFLLQEAVGRLGRDPESPEGVFAGQFRSRANARASKRHVRQTPVWGHGYAYDDPVLGRQDNGDFYRDMQSRVPSAWGALPAVGWFGAWDACGKESVVRQWHEALPRMAERTHRFPDVGHFIEETKGREIGDSIADLVGEVG